MRRKYGNIKADIGGSKIDSRGEAKRFAELQLLEKLGEIRELNRQVKYDLCGAGGTKVCRIIVDFTYWEGNQFVAEDFKGMETKDFLIKEKLFKDNYPGVEFRKSGPWEKIRDKRNAKARAKRQALKAGIAA